MDGGRRLVANVALRPLLHAFAQGDAQRDRRRGVHRQQYDVRQRASTRR